MHITRSIITNYRALRAADVSFQQTTNIIAYDFLCHTPHDAEMVEACLRLFVRQKWHGKQQTVVFKNTQYSRPAGHRRNLAIYADKPSKVTGGPCAHLELRFSRMRKELSLKRPDIIQLAADLW